VKTYFTYIITNKKYGILYTGFINDLVFRAYQHKNKLVKGFTSRYNLDKLVWYEEFDYVWDAIAREKQIKGWTRKKIGMNYLGAEPTRYQIILQHFLIIYEFFVACPPFHEVIPSGEGGNGG